MATVEIRRATFQDAQQIGYNLRVQDRDEVLAEGCPSGQYAVVHSYLNSVKALTVVVDGEPSGIFGLVPDSMLGNSARVWFLGTDRMSSIKKTFVKLSRRQIGEFLELYPRIWNKVDARYKEAVRWLAFCGADITDIPVHVGEDRHPFFFFQFVKEA